MRLARVAVFVAVVLCAVTASAQDQSAPAPEPFRRTVQAQATLGLSDCLGGGCSHGDRNRIANSRVGIGLGASGWYRVLPLFSVGGGLHYNLLGLHDRERASSTGAYWTFEVGGRAHLLRLLREGPIDAFAGVTFGYLVYSIWTNLEETDIELDESTDALFAAITIGAEYALAPRMSVGGLLRVTLPWWLSQCMVSKAGEAIPVEDCDDIADQSDTERDFYPSSIWYLGGTFSYHLGG